MCQKQSRKISFSPKKRERPINKFFNQENIFCVPTAIYGLPSALLLVRQIFCLIIAQMYVPLEGSSRFFVHTYFADPHCSQLGWTPCSLATYFGLWQIHDAQESRYAYKKDAIAHQMFSA